MVQAEEADRRRGRPAAQARVGAADPKAGVLNSVVGPAEPPEHPVRDRAQMRPVLLELPGEPFLLIHVTFLPGRVSWK